MKYFEDYDKQLRVHKGGGNFSNVSQLKLWPNLEAVNLWNNNLSSLEGIEILKQIKYLGLSENKLKETSLEPIRYSIELQYLNLSRNKIASLATLPVLPNLKYLELRANLLEEISFVPLGYCLELQYLGIGKNEISSLGTMPVLPNLKELHANDNNISTMESLSHLPSLERLHLMFNRITSLATIPALPNLKHLDVSRNNISTLAGFPFLPSLEELSISGPVLQIPHVEAASILLVGPSLKRFNGRDLLASEVEVAKQYPAHTSFCIRNGWSICKPDTAIESTFSFLTELWKESMPPSYTLRDAFTGQPSEEDACVCNFSFNHLYGDNHGLIHKYQWFVGDIILAGFIPIDGATDEVYWPKKENVSKYLKVECTSIREDFEFHSFAISKPVLPGTGIPKVLDINVLGELVEGNILKGTIKIAWCGGTPCKGVSSWLRGRLNKTEIIQGAEEEEYKLTFDDVDDADAYIVYMYTPVTQEGLKGEPKQFKIELGKEVQRMKRLEKELSKVKNELEGKKNMEEELSTVKNELEKELDRKEDMEKELSTAKKELEKELDRKKDMEKELSTAKKELEKELNIKKDMEKELSTTKKELEKELDRKKDMEKELSTAKKEIEKELDRKKDMEEELSTVKKELERKMDLEKERLEVKKEFVECCIQFRFEELEKATNNFDKSRKLGEGGFGIVYQGFLRHTQVAIKMLTNNLYQNTRGFKEEIETLSIVRHPNLVTLIGASEEGSEKLALVYEFVRGGSLQDHLFKGKNDSNPPLSWRTRIRIASDICSALIFLHSTPRVHGDLKPDNILLDSNYVSKLSDFGTCRLLKTTETTHVPYYATTKAGAATEGYMDPLYYQNWTLTAKSDVYSFGIVLLQLVTRRNAYKILPFVVSAIKEDSFDRIIDHSAKWPRNSEGQFVEARKLTDLGLKCSRIMPHDRADLVNDVWSVIESLKDDAFDN